MQLYPTRSMLRRTIILMLISVVLLVVLEFRIPQWPRTFCNNTCSDANIKVKSIESDSLQPGLAAEHKGDGLDTDFKDVKLVSGFATEIILLSAVAGNSTPNSTWDKIAITAWESTHLESQNQTYICCVAFASGEIKALPAAKIRRGKETTRSLMKAMQYICTLEEASQTDLPVGVTIADSNKPRCHRFIANYVKVDYAYAHPDEIAVFGKVIYGNISAPELLVWIEMHRAQGVTKFVLYPYEVPDDVMKVLRYYKRQGLLEYIPFLRHTTGTFGAVGLIQFYNDQIVSEYDGLQRLRGYKYLVNFDMDEFILSRKGEKWMDVFDRLFHQHSDAGFFWLRTYFFVKSWGATNATSPFSVGRYLMRTDIISDRAKCVSQPKKIKDVGLSTHHNFLKDGYKKYMADPEELAIYHYRDCRIGWLDKDAEFPCYNITRTHDETVMNVFKKIEKRVFDIVKELGIGL